MKEYKLKPNMMFFKVNPSAPSSKPDIAPGSAEDRPAQSQRDCGRRGSTALPGVWCERGGLLLYPFASGILNQ